jgi:uncharacterized coiled-coil protein SlyX
MEPQLIGAIAALWAALSAIVGGALKWLLADRQRTIDNYEKRIADLEVKLAGAGALMQKQNDALILHVQQQQQLIDYLQKQQSGDGHA